jgi:vesicle coat complex subunit
LSELNFVETQFPVAEKSKPKSAQELQDRDSDTLCTWHKETEDFSSIRHKKELQKFLAEKMRVTEMKFNFQPTGNENGYLQDSDGYY